jgi:hypothetical protein
MYKAGLGRESFSPRMRSRQGEYADCSREAVRADDGQGPDGPTCWCRWRSMRVGLKFLTCRGARKNELSIEEQGKNVRDGSVEY